MFLNFYAFILIVQLQIVILLSTITPTLIDKSVKSMNVAEQVYVPALLSLTPTSCRMLLAAFEIRTSLWVHWKKIGELLLEQVSLKSLPSSTITSPSLLMGVIDRSAARKHNSDKIMILITITNTLAYPAVTKKAK